MPRQRQCPNPNFSKRTGRSPLPGRTDAEMTIITRTQKTRVTLSCIGRNGPPRGRPQHSNEILRIRTPWEFGVGATYAPRAKEKHLTQHVRDYHQREHSSKYLVFRLVFSSVTAPPVLCWASFIHHWREGCSHCLATSAAVLSHPPYMVCVALREIFGVWPVPGAWKSF